MTGNKQYGEITNCWAFHKANFVNQKSIEVPEEEHRKMLEAEKNSRKEDRKVIWNFIKIGLFNEL